MAKVNFDFAMHPKDAYAYLDKKGYKLTYHYDELAKASHHKSFTVAKVTRLDLLQDVHQSLLDAQKAGTPFTKWLDDLKPTLHKKGWWGKKDIIDPKSGEVQTVYIGARRLHNIFATNMRSSYNVARYKKQRDLPNAVYWRYTSLLLPTSRDSHTKMHGTVLHRDNPFWHKNYPLNGWGCKCKVRAYTKAQLQAQGMTITEKTPESIADADWAYDIGAGARVGRITKLNLDSASLAQITPNRELDKRTDAELKHRFYQQLNIAEGGLYIDKVGDPMWIGDELFTAASGHSKLRKRDRHLFMDELAKTISEPDEIYLELEQLDEKRSRIVKKTLRYFTTENGKKKALMALFEYQKDKTIGISVHVINNQGGVEKRRIQRLIYQKDREKSGN